MVTGDNIETAKAIAIDCGIIQEGDTETLVIEGPDFVEQIGGVVCQNCKTERCPCARSKKDAESRSVQMRVDCIAKLDNFK